MTTNQPEPEAASAGQNPALTYYGELLRRQWEGCLPEIYEQIRDPGNFFAVLGEVIAERIDEHADDLAGDDPPGEGTSPRSPGSPPRGITRSNGCSASTSCSRPTRTSLRS